MDADQLLRHHVYAATVDNRTNDASLQVLTR